jgi:SAM-dependent methyltransferase
MSAIAKNTQTVEEFDQLKARLKATWMTGDYDLFSRFMEKDADQFFRRLVVPKGARLLDVGCGSGQLALIAARAGAKVTGCDIATNWLQKARDRAAAEGLEITFDEGDAESLPYDDAQFDVVTSLIGAMFAPRPELVARELTRVCRPGGTIAMANWTPGGFIGQMFKTISRHIAPSGMPSPVLWGDEATVRDRLREGINTLEFARRTYHFVYPFPPDSVVEFFRLNYGPMTRAFGSLDAKGKEQLRTELENLWALHNKSEGNTTIVDAEYLEVIATRGSVLHKAGSSVSYRAELLADRIDEGANALAGFAEGLSDEEWNTPILMGNDSRTAGVLVHHVATMYPIEIDAARSIASGKAVTDITWDGVAQFNAMHAHEKAGVTKAEALKLLRQNSRKASEAVRAFTDEQLDRAAAFSLSYGAPVTSQFVIEDHALRHSWHHLWRIRRTLGR